MTDHPAIPGERTPQVIAPGDIEPEPLTQEDYEAILTEFGRRRQAHWLVLTRVLRATGLREAEVLRLHPEHIIKEGPDTYLLVVRGKKRTRDGQRPKYERIKLHPDVAMHLDGYVAGHRVARGWPVWAQGARAYQYAFRKAALAATGQPHHPHELRGLYADELIDGGVPLAVVSKQLGHSSTRVTQESYMARHRGRRNAINDRVRA